MFCHNCGKEINDNAAVCIHCGVETQKLKKENDKQINIINQSSSTSQDAGYIPVVPIRHSILLDLFLIFCTGGLWIIWMIIRPKYY